MMKKLFLFLILAGMFLTPALALADTDTGEDNGESTNLPNPLTVGTFEELILRIRDILLVFAIPLFGLMVAIAGVYFIVSGGNPAKRKQATDILKYAVIGFVIVVLAAAIVAFVAGLFTAEEPESMLQHKVFAEQSTI